MSLTPTDNVSSAHTADVPPGEEEGGSHSGLAISNIVSLTSRPENTLASRHNAKEVYRHELEVFPGDPQSSRIKLEHNISQLDIARRTTLDHQWLLDDCALQVDLHESPELNSNIVCEIIEDIVQIDDDDSELPQRAVDYINGGAGVRVDFLCASTVQRDRIAVGCSEHVQNYFFTPVRTKIHVSMV